MKKKNKSANKIIDMQMKKTGKLFMFCCLAPVIIANKNNKIYLTFEKIGNEIGLLFQIVDDLIDFKGNSKKAGKKTKKDRKKGKATLINLLGYENTVKYVSNLKIQIFHKLKPFGKRSDNLKKTILFIANREK